MASVAFTKIDHPDHVPAGGEHARFTIAEHQKVQSEFEQHHAAVGAGGGGAAAKPVCHIIACYISDDDGVVCYYHCVSH